MRPDTATTGEAEANTVRESIQHDRKDGADLGVYTKVMLDRIEVWIDTEDRYKGASWMDVRRCAELFDEAMRQALADGYPFVDAPGPDVLRIRLAVTGLQADVDGYSTRENLGWTLPPFELPEGAGAAFVANAARGGSATGLIAYNGSAHLVMPLTKDDRIINTMAESLSPAGFAATRINARQTTIDHVLKTLAADMASFGVAAN